MKHLPYLLIVPIMAIIIYWYFLPEKKYKITYYEGGDTLFDYTDSYESDSCISYLLGETKVTRCGQVIIEEIPTSHLQ